MELLKWIALWFLALAVAVLVLLNTCPWIMTGSYADITINSIKIDTNGQYSLGFSAVAAARTTVITGFYDGAKWLGGGGGSSGSFFGEPTHQMAGVMFCLDPENLTGGRKRVPRPDRLLVREGETHHLNPGERLYLYDFKSPDGVRHYGYIEVKHYQTPALKPGLPPLKPVL